MTGVLNMKTALELPHGLHVGVPSAVYHARVPGMVSKGVLDLVHRTPAHLKAWLDGQEEEPTPALLFGAAQHCALLEPEIFETTYVVEPEFGDCRFKENKARRDEWRKKTEGYTKISREDNDAIKAICQAVRNHPLAGRMLVDGEPELTVRWRDAETGLECKSRADYYVRKHRMAVDIKTSFDASPAEFRRSVANYRYHVQDALYRDGFAAIGEAIEHFVFVVVEKRPPYAVALYSLDRDAVAKGHSQVRTDIARLAECVKADTWPGYPTSIQELNLPPWAA